MHKNTCSVENCGAPVKGHGLCNRHLIRMRKHGSVDAYHPNAQKVCAVTGCSGKHHARGWCVKHWNRWRNAGDPLLVRASIQPDISGPKNGMWRGADITYATAHWRMTRDSPARNHPCDHCGSQAEQWAYMHNAPDEKQSEEGPYSADPHFYKPLCISCHVKFDRRKEEAARSN